MNNIYEQIYYRRLKTWLRTWDPECLHYSCGCPFFIDQPYIDYLKDQSVGPPPESWYSNLVTTGYRTRFHDSNLPPTTGLIGRMLYGTCSTLPEGLFERIPMKFVRFEQIPDGRRYTNTRVYFEIDCDDVVLPCRTIMKLWRNRRSLFSRLPKELVHVIQQFLVA